jgi:hypothetical protein
MSIERPKRESIIGHEDELYLKASKTSFVSHPSFITSLESLSGHQARKRSLNELGVRVDAFKLRDKDRLKGSNAERAEAPKG